MRRRSSQRALSTVLVRTAVQRVQQPSSGGAGFDVRRWRGIALRVSRASVERGKSPGAEFEESAVAQVGVGPHPEPWPDDPRLDRALLAEGDRRNVIDRYRYWSVEAITKDLDERRFEFHVAIENWKHDLNIGTVVRNANAFMAARVHIVGAHRWNRRGAMCTDRYVHIEHHASVDHFVEAMASHAPRREIVGVDLLPGSVLIDRVALPRSCVLVFGQEGVGLSEAMRARCGRLCAIAQFGSTRSINAGVASGIAMHQWIVQHGAHETARLYGEGAVSGVAAPAARRVE